MIVHPTRHAVKRRHGSICGHPSSLAFLEPSAITRNAVLIPAYQQALGALGLDRSPRAGRALRLARGVLHPLASSALVTGGIWSVAAASLLGGFTWLRWLVLMSVPYCLLEDRES